MKDLKDNYAASIEDASIMRKFTVLFIVMSILPLVALIYFYSQFIMTGSIIISELNFKLAMMFLALGVLLGYATMRNLLQKIIDLTNANKKALESVLSPKKIEELSLGQNEIAVLAKSFSVITNRLEENVKSLELAKKTIHSVMTKVGEGISNMQNIDTFLELIVETVTGALSAKAGVLLLIEEYQNELYVKTVHGMECEFPEEIRFPLKEGVNFDSVMESGKTQILTQLILDSVGRENFHKFFQTPLICAPMVIKEKVIGLITVSGRIDNTPIETDELNLLNNLASQVAVAIENSRLSENMELTYFETISALALAVDAKDRYSRGHLDRVAMHCLQMAKKLKLSESDKKTLRDAARLHDIGKIGVPDDILKKEGPLDDSEWEIMRRHPEIGESIIKPIHSLEHLCDIIRHHHEKLDGSGYPDGLKSDQINQLVRITTIADIFDALTTIRPYRKRMTKRQACEELRKMGDKLDQEIVELFIETVDLGE